MHTTHSQENHCLKEFILYAALNVLSMVGMSCYILADTFFVAQGTGSNGLAALNLAIPIYSFIHGCGLMISMGGATRYSILKSQKKEAEGNLVFTHTLLLTLGFAIIFMLFGIFAADIITVLLGADAAIYQMCKTYLQVLLLFSPLFLLNDVMICFVRNDGEPRLAMIAMTAGSLLNILLDYVFIFPLNMGIFGAVLATSCSPIISLLILSSFGLRKKNQFHLIKPSYEAGLWRNIFATGAPSLVTELSSGIVIIVFNIIILGLSGNTGVAAYGVIANLSLVVISIYTGIAQGIQPLISKYYGIGNQLRIKANFRYAILSVLALSALIYIGVFLGAEGITAVFNSENDAALATIAVPGLRIYFIGCIFAGLNIVMSIYFASTDRPTPANIISLLRGFFIILPLSFLLSALGGMIGLWAVFPVTELIVTIIGVIFYLKSN